MKNEEYIYEINSEFTGIIRRKKDDFFANWETVIAVSPRYFQNGIDRYRFLEETLEICKKRMY